MRTPLRFGLACSLVCAALTGWLFAAEAARAEAAPPPVAPETTAAPPAEGAGPAEKPAEAGPEAAPELLLWQEIPTVVSASRREEPASRAPNAVSIITAEDIHASGMTTLGDLLRMAVGVDVGQINNNDFAVGVRGLHGKWSNSTLVLMDGRTIYNPVWGGTSWTTQPIMLEGIERIEVVRERRHDERRHGGRGRLRLTLAAPGETRSHPRRTPSAAPGSGGVEVRPMSKFSQGRESSGGTGLRWGQRHGPSGR